MLKLAFRKFYVHSLTFRWELHEICTVFSSLGCGWAMDNHSVPVKRSWMMRSLVFHPHFIFPSHFVGQMAVT